MFRTNVPPYRLGELLLRIAERRLTGRLLLTSDLGERTIYVHSGLPVFALTSQFSERLGAVGVRYGFLKREDVAAALQLARDKRCEIGRALLELGAVRGTQLFRLLGAQLVEQLAASCGASPTRARFLAEPEVLDTVAILRLHPMTAVLAAVRHMPSAEHAKLLAAVSERRVANLPMPEPAKQWLSEIGCLGDPAALLAGDGTTVAVVRSRLMAKLRASTQQDFDPSASPLPLEVRKEDSVRPAARSVADYLALTLLLSGAVKLADETVDDALGADAASGGGDGVRATLGSALRSPFPELPEAANVADRPVDAAVRAYLEDKREARAASRMAIWGPAAEVGDDPTLEQLLTLYLTLKPEASDRAVLDVAPEDPLDEVESAYAKYRGFLRKLSEALPSPLAQARIAELEHRIGQARTALVSATGASPAPNHAPRSVAPPARPSVPPDAGARSSLPPDVDADGLLRNVEARVREGNWQKVLELLDPLGKGRALPPTLSLAKALAERALATPRARGPRARLVIAFALGSATTWLLARYGLLPTW